MDDIIFDIRQMLRTIWHHRWVALAVSWFVGLCGILLVSLQQDIYEASARVYVDTASQLRLLLDDQIVETDVEDQLRFVRQALLGTTLLERVVKETGLVAGSESPDKMRDTITMLSNQIQIVSGAELNSSRWNGRQRTDDTYLIRYEHTDPVKALTVVEKLLNIFVEDTLGAKRSSSNSAGQFLTYQLSEYERRLQAAEAALADFNRRNYDRLPDLQEGYFQSIQNSREELEQVRQELELAEARLNSVENQIRGVSPIVTVSGELDPNSLEARILDSERRLDELKLRYTDQHPDVSGLQEIVATLRGQLARRELSTSNRVESANNPVLQALQIAKNEAESEVEALRAEAAQRESRVVELQGLIGEMPEVEAERVRLNRDYDVVNRRYQALLESLERDKLSREVLEAEEVEFRVIDPPQASADPIAPQRGTLLFAVLVFSAGAGLGIAYLLGLLRPVFDSADVLEVHTGIPVLGAVDLYSKGDEGVRAKDSTMLLVAGASLLFALLIVTMVFEVLGLGLRL